jgi:hypothetical protein
MLDDATEVDYPMIFAGVFPMLTSNFAAGFSSSEYEFPVWENNFPSPMFVPSALIVYFETHVIITLFRASSEEFTTF